MDGKEIKVGDTVIRYPIINLKKDGAFRKVKSIAPCYEGGELLIWFEEGGGCHHPHACEVFRLK